jgi:hypothetical protein
VQLPKENQHYSVRVRYGVYVARRLRRAKLSPLSEAVASATSEVRAKGRARDDAEDAVQEALADRDAADISLDTIASTARVTLAGRGLKAVKESPYVHIYPDGVAYYTAAPLAQQANRYRELAERLQKYLPADDVCLEHVPAVLAGISDFQASMDALHEARRAKSMLATDLEATEDAWRHLLERTYGALIEQFGKGALVESFFPQVKRASSRDKDADNT